MASRYIEDEARRVAMVSALNRHDARLTDPADCAKAYGRAEIQHFSKDDHDEAVRRAQLMRGVCGPAFARRISQ